MNDQWFIILYRKYANVRDSSQLYIYTFFSLFIACELILFKSGYLPTNLFYYHVN